MVDNTQALMAIDSQSGGAIAPFTTAVPLAPLQAPMMSFLMRMRSAMPWIPSGLEYLAMQAMSLGAFPRLRAFVPGQVRPAWLADDAHYQAWRAMITGPYKSIDLAFLQQNAALAAAATDAAARDVAFWDSIAKYSGEDALEKIWNDFWNAVADLKNQRAAALVSLSTANGILSQYGAAVPPALASQTQALTAQAASLDMRARGVLAAIPGASAQAGLGSPLIIAGIAAGVVVTVTASVWAIAHEFSAVQLNAANNAQALLKWRETADNQAFATGKITNEQLVERRTASIAAANSIVDHQGAAAVGRGFGAAGMGLAMGVGSVAALALGGWLLFKHFNKKSA